MDNRKKTKIERLANKIRVKYSQNRPFLDIFNLVKAMQIDLIFDDLGLKVYGASMITDKKRIISVNSKNPINRQRFSAAHELGHILLHQEKELNVTDRLLFRDTASSLGLDWREIEANYFAACLLMPKALVEVEIQKHSSLDEKEIKYIANKFEVSNISMTNRLNSLGYI